MKALIRPSTFEPELGEPDEAEAGASGEKVLRRSLASYDFGRRLSILKRLKEEENDKNGFYGALSSTLTIAALAIIIIFSVWTQKEEFPDKIQNLDEKTRDRHQLVYVGPLFVALSLFGFAALAFARILLGQMYAGAQGTQKTSVLQSLFQAMTMNNSGKSNADAEKKKDNMKSSARTTFMAAANDPKDEEGKAFGMLDQTQQADYLEIHVHYMEQLAFVVKGMGLSFGLILSINFVIYQLVVDDKTIVETVQAFLFAYVACAAIFTAASFKRLFNTMGTSFLQMPLFQGMLNLGESDWVRAMGILAFAPLAPMIYVLSAINQAVRVKRQLYGVGGTTPADGTGDYIVEYQPTPLHDPSPYKLPRPPETLRLTLRVYIFFEKAYDWPWVYILCRVYIIAVAFAIYSIAPLSIEILLGWFVKVLADFPLGGIVVAVWMVGLVLFLLPPVPGAPVYLFGGILITGKAMEKEMLGDEESGFWFGAALSIFVCWILKLSACAMQQQGIGRLLGSQLWVRQTCGVHKPPIRAIEMILSKPGLSFGKVMILCGGPDWPTSVLCGLLKLSLLSCEIGTTPIIFYIAPFSLSGSFYLRRNESPIWQNASNVMLLITIVMTVVYWAACAWVIQNTFNEHNDELSRKLKKNIDLDWLDYREEWIEQKTSVTLSQAPCIVRAAYISGAVVLLLTFHCFQWFYGSAFGTFKIGDDLKELKWFEGDDAIIKPLGVACLIAVVVGCAGKVVFDTWKSRYTRAARETVTKEADNLESAWKEQERETRETQAPAAPTQPAAATLQETDDPEKTPETYVPPAEPAENGPPSQSKTVPLAGKGTGSQPSTKITSGISPNSNKQKAGRAQSATAKPQMIGKTNTKNTHGGTMVNITETE
jgi:cell division protein FtsL